MHPSRQVVRVLVLAALAVAVGFGAAPSALAAGFEGNDLGPAEVAGLQVEHATDPLGIDVLRPRLGWRLRADRRGVLQSAYRVIVASSRERLARDRGDVWDSGKVLSADSADVAYDGAPLESRRRYHWKVRVYDERGKASDWSEPAWWEMGLLAPADWSARWIGMPPPPQPPFSLEGAKWIWHDEPGGPHYPAGLRYFRRTVELPPDRRVTGARLAVTGDDEFELWVNGEHRAKSVWWYEPRSVDVAEDLHPGRNSIAIAVTNRGREAGMVARLQVDFESGDPLVVPTDVQWRSRDREEPGWTQPDHDDAAWMPTRVLADYGDPPWGTVTLPKEPTPAPLLRKDFRVREHIKRARVYVSGLAYYVLTLNGRRVGDHVLDPVLTDYDDRVNYVSYDVTEQLRGGRTNALGAELGRGFYGLDVANVWDWDKPPWRDEPMLLLQLEIEYADGSTERIGTDPTWEAARGPRLRDSIYVGETYDARREQPQAWEPATLMTPPRGRLVAQAIQPIEVVDTLRPKIGRAHV